jgi:hypothetical protein
MAIGDLNRRAVNECDRLVTHRVEQREQLAPDRAAGAGDQDSHDVSFQQGGPGDLTGHHWRV